MLLLSFCSRKPRLSAAEQQRLVELLKHGPERLGYETPLWTCWRVAHLIEQEFGVRYHAGHVWKLLRAMNWSVQRPTGRALERDEEAIRRWKQHRWTALKKKRKKPARNRREALCGNPETPAHWRQQVRDRPSAQGWPHLGSPNPRNPAMKRPKRDPVREDRIYNEAIVDARPEG